SRGDRFFYSSRRRHTRLQGDWSSDVCFPISLFGEGAGILVLERESLAQDHSAYAACAGAGYSCDAHHITGPDPSGAGAVKVMGRSEERRVGKEGEARADTGQ